MRSRRIRRVVPEPSDYFMDYGPDWPPAPKRRPTSRVRLLRKCAAAVVVYAVIWGLGTVLLQQRTRELRDHPGVSVTTYTAVTAGRG